MFPRHKAGTDEVRVSPISKATMKVSPDPSPDVMSNRYHNSFYLGDMQLVWHCMELSKEETNQTCQACQSQ